MKVTIERYQYHLSTISKETYRFEKKTATKDSPKNKVVYIRSS